MNLLTATPASVGNATVFATLLSGYAVKRGSLNKSGGMAAWGVGWVAWIAGGWHTAALLAFFFGSTFMTKVGKKTKATREEGYGGAKGRNAWQVAANGGVGTVAALAWLITHNERFLYAHLISYAAAAGDTWASELGILSTSQPRLVLGGRLVPHGTNGGITPMGTLASALGGLSVGCASALFSPLKASTPSILLLATGAGLVGSFLDSALGQVFEYSGWHPVADMVTNTAGPHAQHISGLGYLSNDTVNVLACVLTTTGLTLLVA